jgi:hypothetical protein
MSSSVFSRGFQTIKGLTGTGPSIIVPAGHVYIVKQVTIYSSPILGLLTCFLEDEATGAALIAQDASISSALWFGFYGGLVFPEGGGWHFQVDNSFGEAADVSVSGYDLVN